MGLKPMRFIQDHAFVNLLSMVITSSTVCILGLRFLLQLVLVLIGEAASTPIVLTHAFWHGWHLPIKFYFSFTDCSTTPWTFASTGFSDVSNLDIISRAPLLRALLRVQHLQRFQRLFQNGLVNFAVIYAQYGLPDPHIFLMVFALLAGLMFLRLLLSVDSCGILSLVYLFPRGSNII